jgi:hypothetical protein
MTSLKDIFWSYGIFGHPKLGSNLRYPPVFLKLLPYHISRHYFYPILNSGGDTTKHEKPQKYHTSRQRVSKIIIWQNSVQKFWTESWKLGVYILFMIEG